MKLSTKNNLGEAFPKARCGFSYDVWASDPEEFRREFLKLFCAVLSDEENMLKVTVTGNRCSFYGGMLRPDVWCGGLMNYANIGKTRLVRSPGGFAIKTEFSTRTRSLYLTGLFGVLWLSLLMKMLYESQYDIYSVVLLPCLAILVIVGTKVIVWRRLRSIVKRCISEAGGAMF